MLTKLSSQPFNLPGVQPLMKQLLLYKYIAMPTNIVKNSLVNFGVLIN